MALVESHSNFLWNYVENFLFKILHYFRGFSALFLLISFARDDNLVNFHKILCIKVAFTTKLPDFYPSSNFTLQKKSITMADRWKMERQLSFLGMLNLGI